MSSFFVISCVMISAMVLTVVLMKLFHSVSLYVPIPRRNPGTPMMAAMVFLLSSTVSLMARSDRDSGFTDCTSMNSDGTIHGSPGSVWTYSSISVFLPSLVLNSSVRPSTLMITAGFQLDSRKPFSVLLACFRLFTTSMTPTLMPVPFHGRYRSGFRTKCSSSSGSNISPETFTLYPYPSSMKDTVDGGCITRSPSLPPSVCGMTTALPFPYRSRSITMAFIHTFLVMYRFG